MWYLPKPVPSMRSRLNNPLPTNWTHLPAQIFVKLWRFYPVNFVRVKRFAEFKKRLEATHVLRSQLVRCEHSPPHQVSCTWLKWPFVHQCTDGCTEGGSLFSKLTFVSFDFFFYKRCFNESCRRFLLPYLEFQILRKAFPFSKPIDRRKQCAYFHWFWAVSWRGGHFRCRSCRVRQLVVVPSADFSSSDIIVITG